MKKTLSLALVLCMALCLAAPVLADYGSKDPNWTPMQGVSPDFLATLPLQNPIWGYQEIGNVPEYGMKQIGPVEVSAPKVDMVRMLIEQIWEKWVSGEVDAPSKEEYVNAIIGPIYEFKNEEGLTDAELIELLNFILDEGFGD